MNQPDRLSPDEMQLFLAGLSGMSPEEVRKAKLLYLRNAISEYHAARANADLLQRQFFGGCLGFGRRSMFQKAMENGLKLQEERIRNALEVWRDDLKGETFEI
jgi:hypothetical protein